MSVKVYNGSAWVLAWDGPPSRTDLRFWYDADTITQVANGAAVTDWTDGGPLQLHTKQDTSGSRPLLRTAVKNGHNAVEFDGSDDWLQRGGLADQLLSTTGYWTVYAVAKSDTVTGTHSIIDMDAGSGARHAQALAISGTSAQTLVFGPGGTGNATDTTTGVVVSTWQILEAQRRSGFIETWVNGASNGATATALGVSVTNASGAWNIGRQGSGLVQMWDGHIACVIGYGTALNSTEQAAVRAWLTTRYAL